MGDHNKANEVLISLIRYEKFVIELNNSQQMQTTLTTLQN